ncbi:hypothetical protein [Nonomuraea sp. NPDC003727]
MTDDDAERIEAALMRVITTAGQAGALTIGLQRETRERGVPALQRAH